MSEKRRILIVDDDVGLCSQLGMIVDYFGYQPVLAHTLGDARGLFKSETPDLVIADLHLPDGTGTDLLHEFHQVDPDLPVIILTGFPSESSIRQTMLEGGYTYLAKPVALDQLRHLIEHALKDRGRT